jgi:hypothetical protein
MQVRARSYLIPNVESDEERLNILFHNENVAINGMCALMEGSTGKVVLILNTARGEAHLELTREFANQVVAALRSPAEGYL